MSILAAALLALQAATPASPDADNDARLRTGAQLLRDRQPQAAYDVLSSAVAAYDASYRNEKRRLYCGLSPSETILYLAAAAKDKADAVAVEPGYCTALFLQGFALVDLGRTAEARAAYTRLIALAPMHAHYLTELGQLDRLDKNWAGMLATCKRAQDAAALAPADTRKADECGALRCQGYALVEQHQWDAAVERYRAALKIDPSDVKAQGELRYIAERRGK